MTIVDFLRARWDETEARLSEDDQFWMVEFILADIAAKRAILDEYEKSAARTVAHGAPSNTEVRTGALADVVQLLAQPYAEHPEFQEGWKV